MDHSLLGFELDAYAVNAVSKPGWFGPVRKHVTKVTAAVGAGHLDAPHSMACIQMLMNF